MSKKILIVVLVILAVAGASCLILSLTLREQAGPAPIAQESDGEPPLVGGDRDAHDCIGSAGYSWCEAKSKCLRVFEEFCPDFVAELADAIREASGVTLAHVGETDFDWMVVEGDVSAATSVTGLKYSAEGVSPADYDRIEGYMDGNYEADLLNMADGVDGGLRGYRVGYMACALRFLRPTTEETPEGMLKPEGDSLEVSLECGYFNPNDISRIVVGHLIAEGLAEKYDKAIDEVSVTVWRMDDAHAAGSVMFGEGGPGEGGGVLAVKTDGDWQVVYDGNGSVDCDRMKQEYGFSDEILQPNFCD